MTAIVSRVVAVYCRRVDHRAGRPRDPCTRPRWVLWHPPVHDQMYLHAPKRCPTHDALKALLSAGKRDSCSWVGRPSLNVHPSQLLSGQ